MFKTVANKLTVSRILVIPPILVLLAIHHPWAAWLALVLFIAAGITDLLDGHFARLYGEVSMIGQFLDPIADKLLVSAVILMLVHSGQIGGLAVWPAVIAVF